MDLFSALLRAKEEFRGENGQEGSNIVRGVIALVEGVAQVTGTVENIVKREMSGEEKSSTVGNSSAMESMESVKEDSIKKIDEFQENNKNTARKFTSPVVDENGQHGLNFLRGVIAVVEGITQVTGGVENIVKREMSGEEESSTDENASARESRESVKEDLKQKIDEIQERFTSHVVNSGQGFFHKAKFEAMEYLQQELSERDEKNSFEKNSRVAVEMASNEDAKSQDDTPSESSSSDSSRSNFSLTGKFRDLQRLPSFNEDFVELTELGRGSFGFVSSVRSKTDKAEYAMKQIQMRSAEEQLPLREVEAMARLRHPNIVTYHHSWIETDKNGRTMLFIKMELCSSTLESKLNEECSGPYRDLKMVLHWFRQLTEAVDYIHSHGFFHRDLKPANLLFSSHSTLKVADLGIASLADRSLVTAEKGTLLYMAPEQTLDFYSNKVDIFSMGLILVEMLLVMNDDTRKMIFWNYRNPSEKTNVLGEFESVSNLVNSMTSWSPADRPSAVTILDNDLFKLLQ